MREPEVQSTGSVMLIRPVRFQSNPLTRESNAFQAQEDVDDLDASNQRAQMQFDGLVRVLRDNSIECVVFDDTPQPHTPDSVFPNNWISMHASGCVVVYPMEAVNRRDERRTDVINALRDEHGFEVGETLDLAFAEQHGQCLEGTGSLVLDRVNRVAYACLSSRTNERLARDWCDKMGYRPVLFDAHDASGLSVYHTNVMMCIGTSVAIICADAIESSARAAVMAQLKQDGHEIVEIDFAAMNAFAGNMLELTNADGERLMAMSAQAERALSPAQRARLEAHVRIISAPIEHIEAQSGGSVRCMLAEIHLPRR